MENKNENKICQSCKKDFVIDQDDFGFYEQMKVPVPTWCPDCRLVRRFAWTAYRSLYKRPCSRTGESLLSIYHPESPYITYRQDIWWGDSWDPKSYGIDYNFSRPFFEQFDELLKKVPLPVLHTEHATMTNSPYCNAASELRNCYLCFMADRSEDCAYLNSISLLKDCFDMTFSNNNELCYEGLNPYKCYQTFFTQDCIECYNVVFSKDLVSCSNCLGCINLRNKQYNVFNIQYTKEEYEEKLKTEFDFGSYQKTQEIKKKIEEHFLKFPRRNFHAIKAYNNSVGDYLYNCKNVKDSFWVDTAENIRYSQLLQALNSANCYDYSGFAYKAEWIYECAWVGIQTNNVKFTFWNYSANDIEYCFGCHSSRNMFGCVGVRNSEYCIFNKQYKKDDYYVLVDKIKKQMNEMPYVDKLGRKYCYGEFFPNEICPWKYNETRGQEYFPIKKEEALEQGFLWRDSDPREFLDATIEIPDHIKDVTDEVLKAILKCNSCGKNFRIIEKELVFLRRFNLPIPRDCPSCRDLARIRQMNPIKIFERNCDKCKESMKTSYAPDKLEIVYCEKCYQQEVY